MIVLDTHVWIWLINDDHARLKSDWMPLLEGDDDLAVSAKRSTEREYHLFRSPRRRPRSRSDSPSIIATPMTGSSLRARLSTSQATLISADRRFADYLEIAGRLVQ